MALRLDLVGSAAHGLLLLLQAVWLGGAQRPVPGAPRLAPGHRTADAQGVRVPGVTPDDIRQLAHMMETDVGVVALCEALESGRSKSTTISLLKERLEAASLRYEDVRLIGATLMALAAQMEYDFKMLATAHEGPPEPYGEDHVASVTEFPR